ncbi:DUF982 domain-containing protein [Rhizobium sp. XQZ8]|uniref:DUF982 domain-containing protein n=1 Tax=Rhizobium populisoli TaxID=2859785 RepID=UPI001C67D19C|nr:DUF982 domain-containing protein [Rhizobium populisoli]MBW6425517.1 DUF982 domain-containing protein [Rhizobium populisoli]
MDSQWNDPVRVNDGELRITIASAAQARSFIQHARHTGRVWEEAMRACSAAADGRMSNAEARRAFLKAAN